MLLHFKMPYQQEKWKLLRTHAIHRPWERWVQKLSSWKQTSRLVTRFVFKNTSPYSFLFLVSLYFCMDDITVMSGMSVLTQFRIFECCKNQALFFIYFVTALFMFGCHNTCYIFTICIDILLSQNIINDFRLEF